MWGFHLERDESLGVGQEGGRSEGRGLQGQVLLLGMDGTMVSGPGQARREGDPPGHPGTAARQDSREKAPEFIWIP